jgi:hypothetical protein
VAPARWRGGWRRHLTAPCPAAAFAWDHQAEAGFQAKAKFHPRRATMIKTPFLSLALLLSIGCASAQQPVPVPQPKPCRGVQCQNPVEREVDRTIDRSIRTVGSSIQRAINRVIRDATDGR